MTIKEKITPELKNRFLQEIRTTIDHGKERGFFICKDEKDRLSATKSCEGKECGIDLSILESQCHFKIQGEFHTHPHASESKKYFEEKLGRKVSLEDTKRILKDAAKDKKVSLTEPSYGDVLGTIISRYTGNTSGTTCIGTDIEPDTVECWTTKNKITEENFFTAAGDLFGDKDVEISPLKWTRNLFNKEIIDLK